MATQKRNTGSGSTDADLCHVFVSRREKDYEVFGKDTQIRKKLLAYGAKRLSFWDMSDNDPGRPWRDQIDENLEKAKLLFLVLTRSARRDFAWPIYEAGKFSGLAQTKPGSTVCLYPVGESMPRPLKHLQGVPAEKERVTNLLMKLYKDRRFTHTLTPINDMVDEDGVKKIAEDICNQINGSSVDEIKSVEYINPYIQITLIGDVCKTDYAMSPKRFCDCFQGVKVSSDKDSMRTLFSLAASNGSENWTWRDLEDRTKLQNDIAKFNSNWMRDVEAIVRNYILNENPNTQVESGYLAKEERVWQPEIEKIYTYTTGRITLDITFSPNPHRSWMRGVSEHMPWGGLVANIMIGSRIRQEVIQESFPLLERLESVPKMTDEEVDNLKRKIQGVQRDGFFISSLTSNSIYYDFERKEDRQTLRDLESRFGDRIGEPLNRALAKKDGVGIRSALLEWTTNNAEFLKIALRRYAETLEESHSTNENAK